ncbi:MAG TPA: type I secretion system permease/ATPase, partial [Synechococcales bacterium UBA12195]|nr:type I secretion system permease/ATPase [Synechococcales bacterium UBA12195]
LGLDQRKEAFTLQRFGSGEIVGGELLLRGINGLTLTAATAVEGSLLPAERFFQLLDRQPEHLRQFCSLSAWELWAAAASRQDPRYPTAQELLRWARQACELSDQPIRLLAPGSHELGLSDGSWLVSSDNIEGETLGTVLQSPCRLEVLGRLPARLLPLPSHWPPQRQLEP